MPRNEIDNCFKQIKKLKKLIQFAHSQENEDMSDGEVLDYLLDELEKITS